MEKYVLTQGEEKDKNTIDTNKLLKVKLCIIKENIGFIKRGELYNLCSKYGYVDNICFDETDIIVKKPISYDLGITPRYVTEFLTGTKIPFVGIGVDPEANHFYDKNYIINTRKKELDAFATDNHHAITPSVDETWNYIQEHENVAAYAKDLETLLEEASRIHEEKKQEQRAKQKMIKKYGF